MKVSQVIFQTVRRFPSEIAVVQDDLSWKYLELERQIWMQKQRLRDAGVKKGDRVAIWLGNSPQYVAVYLAVLDVGGIGAAFHPRATVSEVMRALEHLGARGLVTTDKMWTQHCEILQNSGIGFVLLSERTVRLSGFVESHLEAPADTAQIVYTSGTTGEPKGVMLSHANLVENTRAILACLHLTPADSIAAVLPFAFVYGNSVLLTHLFAGAKLVFPRDPTYQDLIIRAMKKEETTGFSGVASNYAFMLRHPGFDAVHLPAMRYFTSAGGPMPSGLLRQVRQSFPACEFHIMYGQTEATARLTMLPPDEIVTKRGSAGKPVPGVALKILRENGQSAAPGEIGEITVAGPNIMQGYWRNPVAGAKVLRGGMLHTGDLGYLDQDGYLFIIGRKSEMIKSGEFRISPSEIEEVLLQQPDVCEAAVFGIEDVLLGETIIAAVALKPNRSLSEKILLSHCARVLPSYKRPKTVIFMEALPKSSNGKTLRQILREQIQNAQPEQEITCSSRM